ncbi:MAG TPA: HD domain-containing protein, partial [Armatimonadota bacterium]|nr:HD domain-containing protein [Armatimonadota bacterium]
AAYFRHAEHINRVSQRVVHWVLDSRLDLGSGLACVRRRVECTSPELFLSQPSNLIRAFFLAQSLGIGFSPDLETLISGASEGPGALQPDGECGPLLLRILEAPERVAVSLTIMAQMGVLGWILPEFAPLMTLAPRNSAHEYTVGYHSLEVVRRLEGMREESSASLFREVFSHLDYPATIFLAALLHDSGRAFGGSGHAAQGAAQVPAIGIRLDMEPQQAHKAQILVEHHLLMSEISRFRDINQEASIKELTAVAPDQDLLDHLFLLTYADGASVGKSAWSPLQARFLEALYDRAVRILARPESDIGEIDLRRYQRKVARALSAHNLDPEHVARHVDLMPAPYLLNTPPQTMALHIEMVEKLQVFGKPVVEFRDDRDGQFTELIICVYDEPRPGLLSKIAGCLWAHAVSVHAAQVFTREAAPRIALDTLWLDLHGHTLDPYAKRRLEMDLAPVLAGNVSVRELLIAAGKGDVLDAPLHEPEVAAHRTDGHTICEVRVGDQRGLLYRITHAISELGWNITSARINSDGTRARDVFYVAGLTDVATEEAARLLRERLVAPR